MDSLPPPQQQYTPIVDPSGHQSNRTHLRLEHASVCTDSQCPLPVCVNLKMATSHARTCLLQKCATCFHVKLIALHHVKSCRRDSSCPMPLCLETKVKQQYIKLSQELSGEIIRLSDTDPSGDFSTTRHARTAAGCRFTRAKRSESWEVQLDDVTATPQRKLPRYQAIRSPEMPTTSPGKVKQKSTGSFGLGKNTPRVAKNIPAPKHHKTVQSVPAGNLQQKPGNPVLQVLQQLMQVLALSQTCEEEAVMVSLLEKTVREAQAKITSFKDVQVDKCKPVDFSGCTDITQGAPVQEEPLQRTGSFGNRCPSPDFIRELFE